MRLTMLKSKIHRLTVTDADLEYDGSFTLDEELMEAAGLLPFEKVDLYNVTNGARLHTYVIRGERGSRIACANGAAAHHVRRGDIVILASYAEVEATEAPFHRPVVVLVDGHNEPRNVAAGAGSGAGGTPARGLSSSP
jgi:aspartate 1-decarboxylase